MAFEKRIDGSVLYNGIIVNVHLDRAELVNGDIVRREVVEHPGGVSVIPVEEDGTVWCVRQFRYPFGREMLEIPAGKLEKGEEPLPAAVRELSEETGLEAGRIIYLGPAVPRRATPPKSCTYTSRSTSRRARRIPTRTNSSTSSAIRSRSSPAWPCPAR